MRPDHIDRRRFLRQGAALAAAASLTPALEAGPAYAAGGGTTSPDPATPTTAKDALERLLEGNARFAAGRSRQIHTGRAWRQEIVSGQHPFATIVGCADSRVPPELIFDQGFGDIFVIRIAGQAVDKNLLGSFQYAGLHLRTPLCVVLGHEGCGAVQAALMAKVGRMDEPEQLAALVGDISPALDGLPLDGPPEAVLHAAVERNVRYSLSRLMKASGTGLLGRMGEAMVGMVYDLETGRVRLLT